MAELRVFDLFCGAGGSSLGAQLAGGTVVGGVDHDSVALQTYADNFAQARVYPGAAEDLDLDTITAEIGEVDLLVASPECTSHTHAKGNTVPSEKSRNTAFQVVRYAAALKPRWVILENVVNMAPWSRYGDLIEGLEGLNYSVSEVRLNAADFGVPQRRRRLFLLCDNAASPPKSVHPPSVAKRPTARSVVNLNGAYSWSSLRTARRAMNTLLRADRAVANLGPNTPFLLVYYGTDKAGGWQRLDVPLRTVTTLDRFAVVKPSQDGHVMRMLQVPELKTAMGFAPHFRFLCGTRRDQVRLLGNAVCPPVMEAVVRLLCADAIGPTDNPA